jgi:tight adherence protein B
MSGIVFLLVAASVFFISLVVYNVLMKGFEQYQERYLNPQLEDLSEMFLFVDPRQMLLLSLSVMVLAFLVGIFFFGYIVTAMLTAAGFFFPTFLVRYYRKRRIRMFNVQLVDALNQIANSLKAGQTLLQAMDGVARDAPVPLSQEFGLTLKELRLGVPMDDALNNMARRVGCDDLDLVVVSTNIARTLGGNMAEMFDTIAATIRERFRIEGRIRALTAQGKLQGWIVASLPLFLWFVMDYMRPDLMEPMLVHWFGYALIATIVFMEALGVFFIRRIVNIDV